MIAGLLSACFGQPPPLALRLVNQQLSVQNLGEYKVNPVLGATHSRLAYADLGEAAEWRVMVQAMFPHPALATFLASAPNHARRMIDTDFLGSSVVYLDDLQDIMHVIPSTAQLMCSCLHIPSGERTLITRHARAPTKYFSPSHRAWPLLMSAPPGLWGVRWRNSNAESVLWITECRRLRNFDQAMGIAKNIGHYRRLDPVQAWAGAHQLRAYADALEVGEGAWLTLNFEKA